MKVLFISNDTTIFDDGSATRARMRAYARAIGELHIISRAAQRTEIQDGNLYLHGLRPLPTIFGRVLFLRTLSRVAHQLIHKYDIEVVSAQDPFEHGRAALRAARNTNAKLHIQVHTDFCSPFFAKESYKNRLRLRIADLILPKADGVRVVSQRVKQGIIKRYGKRISEPVVIPIALIVPTSSTSNSVSSEQFPKQSFTFVLMAVARLEKEKRLDDAIRVVAELVKKQYPAELIIIGTGREQHHLTMLARRLNIEDRIIFFGERKDVSALLKNAQAFIQTSAYEGYGRTYIEAALACVPMVVTDAGIIGEVFKHNESALVCPVGDIACLSSAVSCVIEDMSLRHILINGARVAVQSHLNAIGDLPKRIADDLKKTISHS